jgi:two-component system, OmpR family, sensor histidine kinase VanS
MRTSIKSRLFLIIYGIILAFIAGLIILNNTYLEYFYTEYRERTLMIAFDEIKALDIGSNSLSDSIVDVESDYNISVNILKQTVLSTETDNPDFPEMPVPYLRIYGNQFIMRDGIIGTVMRSFNEQLSGESTQDVDPVPISGDDSYIAYLARIVPTDESGTGNEDYQLLALCVAQIQPDGFLLYYILTVSFQSIHESIAIFNTFTIIIGFIFMILAGIVVYMFSYRFTNPILQMNEVTQDLANLNFNKRVEMTSHDELGDLGVSINKMSSQLETSIKELKSANQKLAEDIQLKDNIDKMRREFIANASHELKTPISLILGYSEALKLSGLTDDMKEDYLNIIMDESNKMNKLVMGLLKISQLESGFQQINLMEFSLKDFTDETVKLYTIKLSEKQIVPILEVSDDIVMTDYDALQTVMTNYISNALNHIDDHRILKISSQRLNDKSIRVSVFNSGKPIPQDSLDRIWESFYKVDKARTRAYGGQGLGLSIVKTILTNLALQYGVINHESGVEFYFDIQRKTE